MAGEVKSNRKYKTWADLFPVLVSPDESAKNRMYPFTVIGRSGNSSTVLGPEQVEIEGEWIKVREKDGVVWYLLDAIDEIRFPDLSCVRDESGIKVK
jgi:hypothetical protein